MSSLWDHAHAQPVAVDALRAALRADEVAHAWVLVGPADVGQLELTRALAAALNCPDPSAPDVGCGVCTTCDRIARDAFTAVESFEPEGQFHLVDAVRDTWIATAMRTQTEGRTKVLRIVAADRMNEATQNAFLKILEEPPASVVWVLDVEDESAMLDTILSRCRRLAVVPWSRDALAAEARARGTGEADAVALASAALGSPRRLRDLADDPAMAAARGEHLTVVDQLATGGPGRVVPLAKELAGWARSRVAPLKEHHARRFAELEEAFGVDGGRGWPVGVKAKLEKRYARLERAEVRRALDFVLDTLASQLRDVLAVQGGASAQQLVNLDHVEAVRRDAERMPAAGAVEGLRAIARCREALDQNGAPELQLERVLLALALPLYAQAVAS